MQKIIVDKCGGAFIVFLGNFSQCFRNLKLPSANTENRAEVTIPVSELWKPLMPQEDGNLLNGKPKILFFLKLNGMTTDSNDTNKTVRDFNTKLFRMKIILLLPNHKWQNVT